MDHSDRLNVNYSGAIKSFEAEKPLKQNSIYDNCTFAAVSYDLYYGKRYNPNNNYAPPESIIATDSNKYLFDNKLSVTARGKPSKHLDAAVYISQNQKVMKVSFPGTETSIFSMDEHTRRKAEITINADLFSTVGANTKILNEADAFLKSILIEAQKKRD